MKVITRQLIANSLADRFRRWEADHPEYSARQNEKGIRPLWQQIEELGPTPDPDACDEVVGTYMWGKFRKGSTWTPMPTCHECGSTVPVAVQVGEEPDYESATATMCIPCLQAAVKLADATLDRATSTR